MFLSLVWHGDDLVTRTRACILNNSIVLVLAFLGFFVFVRGVLVRTSFFSDGGGIIPAYCRRRLVLFLYFLSIVDSGSVLFCIKGYFLSINDSSISLNLVILIRIEQARGNVLF